MPKQQMFLERKGYRMRRLMDAVRLVPILGLGLWMVPLLWSHPDEPGGSVSISSALTYLFGVWFVLIGVVLVLWAKTRFIASETMAQTSDDAGD
tara:strand:- start:1198 stop:1479 length:282 start_codon:yes stop_codon:yes gene_type:complete